mmetsp:Transcript_73507/g.163307  ORF Transcript_73507/g.163307 Transcript_73507/m.163307 type:complete len:121 (+) Transcript_73507:746-1108(+)
MLCGVEIPAVLVHDLLWFGPFTPSPLACAGLGTRKVDVRGMQETRTRRICIFHVMVCTILRRDEAQVLHQPRVRPELGKPNPNHRVAVQTPYKLDVWRASAHAPQGAKEKAARPNATRLY